MTVNLKIHKAIKRVGIVSLSLGLTVSLYKYYNKRKKEPPNQEFYRIETIRGKGLGCVAVKDIQKGTIVLEEKPQCTADWSGSRLGMVYVHSNEILVLLFGQLFSRIIIDLRAKTNQTKPNKINLTLTQLT